LVAPLQAALSVAVGDVAQKASELAALWRRYVKE